MAGQGGLATKVRTRLEVIEGGKPKDSVIPEKIDEIWYKKPVRQHVKEFAVVFAFILVAIAGYQVYREKPADLPFALISVAGVLMALGYKAPIVLHPAWKAWMKFAHVLGFFMTGLILGIAWTIVLLPVALILKIISKKVMDLTYKAPVSTYWEDRDTSKDDFKLLERQF